MNTQDIIQNIHTLVSHNVIGDKQLMNRYKGFRAELEAESHLSKARPNHKQFEGGIIISRSSNQSSLNDSTYFTLTPSISDTPTYQDIYGKLAHIGFKKMYLIQYSETELNQESVMKFPSKEIFLPVPKFTIYEYDTTNNQFTYAGNSPSIVTGFFTDVQIRKANQYYIGTSELEWLIKELSTFDTRALFKIYVNRLFFDGFIGFGKVKGKSSDIDLILSTGSDYRLIEIKEKDLPKRHTKGFGLDTPRIIDMERIENSSTIPYFLIVKHIDNQIDRNLVAWRYISIKNFIMTADKKTVEGGTGMRSSFSSNPTKICPLENFKEL